MGVVGLHHCIVGGVAPVAILKYRNAVRSVRRRPSARATTGAWSASNLPDMKQDVREDRR
jgi:hypothetical protein